MAIPVIVMMGEAVWVVVREWRARRAGACLAPTHLAHLVYICIMYIYISTSDNHNSLDISCQRVHWKRLVERSHWTGRLEAGYVEGKGSG